LIVFRNGSIIAYVGGFVIGLHLIMHQTVGLTGYIGLLTLTLALILTLVR